VSTYNGAAIGSIGSISSMSYGDETALIQNNK